MVGTIVTFHLYYENLIIKLGDIPKLGEKNYFQYIDTHLQSILERPVCQSQVDIGNNFAFINHFFIIHIIK